jgi:predicted GNAT family N-acyltransferase
MRVDIKQREDLTENETIALIELSHAVYPPDETRVDGSAQIQWSDSMWSILLWDDNDNLVTHIGMLTRQVMCDNDAYFIGGIGGVKTHPDARGKGYAGIGMVHATKYLHEECNVDFSLLVCSDEMIKYYQKFGWKPFKGDMMVQQTIGLTKFTFNKPMLITGKKAVPECSVIDVCGKPW